MPVSCRSRPSDGSAPGGRVVVANGRAALVSSLAPPPSGPHLPGLGPAGRRRQAGAAADVLAPGAVVIVDRRGSYAQLAVTVEPSGGSQAPSQAPFAAATL